MWLGDDAEITIRLPHRRTKPETLRVLQAAAVGKPDLLSLGIYRGKSDAASANTYASDENVKCDIDAAATATRDRQLLDKHALERMTSLDMATIYRKMAARLFPSR